MGPLRREAGHRRTPASTSSTSAAARRRSSRRSSCRDWSAGSTRRGAWDHAEEITFECEPGTITEAKLAAIRELGVTRLSLGVENFDDRVLELNGRAHRSPEVARSYEAARALNFPQINIDLIAGMLGETEANWRDCIERTLALEPDSVTIYQMELPYNTTISGDLLKGGGQFAESVADWATKRRWVQEAFAALERAGYHIGSAYTAVKNPSKTKFVYRDRLWEGADLLGLGVASFGHVNGVHVQNLDKWPAYQAAIESGEIPLGPRLSSDRRRTFDSRVRAAVEARLESPRILRGEVRRRRARRALPARSNRSRDDGYLAEAGPDRVALTREGLMRVDVLLPRFFLPEHAGIRYT